MRPSRRGHYLSGNDLCYIRVIAYLSQGQVARRMGVAVTYISELERMERVLPWTALKYVIAVSKALRAVTRCPFHGKGPHRQVDLDEVLERWPRDFEYPPPRGKELAKLVRLTTPREVWAWSRYHGADALDPEQLELLGQLAVWPAGIDPGKPAKPKQPEQQPRAQPPPRRLTMAEVRAERERLREEQRRDDEVTVSDVRWGPY